jgi:Trk K+ transport system NAD-binding subunit
VGVVTGDTVIMGDDILVLFGHIRDLRKFIEENN